MSDTPEAPPLLSAAAEVFCPPAAPQILEAVVKMADCPYLSWQGHWAPHRVLAGLESIGNVGQRVRVTIELLP